MNYAKLSDAHARLAFEAKVFREYQDSMTDWCGHDLSVLRAACFCGTRTETVERILKEIAMYTVEKSHD